MKRVLLGMSGGIDSTVAAYLLKEQGYEVVGFFSRYRVDTKTDSESKKSENKCCSLEAQLAAKKTCDKLGIEFHILDQRIDFKEEVVNYFLQIHKEGLTPNPCLQCNQKIKWGDLFGKLKKFDCDLITTGHYVQTTEKSGKIYAKEGVDKKKDQSYFLSVLSHKQLEKIIFPLGKLTKEETKKLAKKYGEEEVFKKKESQGVCFFNEDSYTPFLKRHLPGIFKPGEIVFVDKNGEKKVVGKHEGLPFFTIGQRKGIGVGGFEDPVYVIGFDREKNQVLLGEDKWLWTKKLILVNPILTDELKERIRKKGLISSLKNLFNPIKLRIRHLGFLREVKEIQEKDGKLFVKLKKAIRAVTPGQFAVFYSKDERVLGNGMIF